MTILRLIALVALAYILGFGAGNFGSVALHDVESQTVSPPRETVSGSIVTLAATPGLIAAEWQAGYDWHWDEAWEFRSAVRRWNALICSTFALLLGAPIALRRVLRHCAGFRPSTPVQGYNY